ncbi:MAG: HAD-IIIA family hydrolase [Bacteroidetes bacterium]|nr:HAD-IIIA family hydrolase [Bacteroidota bacterium]
MNTNLSANIGHLLAQKKIDFAVLKRKIGLKASSVNSVTQIADLISIAAFFKIDYNTLLKDNLQNKTTPKPTIKILIVDVDGVLTDGGMYYTESGDEFKKFNTKDGLQIKALTKKGFQVGLASNGINKNLITKRAKLLGIQNCYVGTEPKVPVIEKWLRKLKLSWTNVAYIGDDLNDVELFKKVGFAACPADAAKEIKTLAHVVLERNGGNACVREFIDTYLHRYT